MSKNVKNKELVEQLNTQAKTQTKSEIAQTQTQAQKTIKSRNVQDFIVKKTFEETQADNRTVVKELRNYMLNTSDMKNFEVYNATMYFNAETQKIELFTQDIANKEVNKFVASLKSNSHFTAEVLRTLLKTCGGAYGDKIRKALYAISIFATQKQIADNFAELQQKATQTKKQLIFYNTIEDSRRAKYEFIKV